MHTILAYRMRLPLYEEREVRAVLVADWPTVANGADRLDDFTTALVGMLPDDASLYRASDRYMALVLSQNVWLDRHVAGFVHTLAGVVGCSLNLSDVTVPDVALARVRYTGPEFRGIAPHDWMMTALREAFDMTLPAEHA